MKYKYIITTHRGELIESITAETLTEVCEKLSLKPTTAFLCPPGAGATGFGVVERVINRQDSEFFGVIWTAVG